MITPGRTRISPNAHYFLRANLYSEFYSATRHFTQHRHFTWHKTRQSAFVPGNLCSIDKLYTHAVLKSTETLPVQKLKQKTHKQITNNKQHTHDDNKNNNKLD